MIKIKRIYEPAGDQDGYRVLIDRLWPRGMTKQAAAIDHWAKAVTPSNDLRRWFDHDAKRWEEFQTRYTLELANAQAQDELAKLRAVATTRIVTLLTATRHETQNHAVFLRTQLSR
jgi:uncharacterized protein YeaO (DUF488 family)